ncbi:MAG: nuoG, partial [Solirubrobacterales bacterium]|nr:nuoG [Solirubrobacterales bacterium]
LTSRPYRFRARPWDIEGAGSVCTLCPSQCNVTFTVRDDKVLRVLSRDTRGHDGVDDGWLCDKGRFAYQSIHAAERITEPLIRDGGELRPVSWERALEEAAGGLRRAGDSVQAMAGGDATNEEAFLLSKIFPGRVQARPAAGPSDDLAAALAHPSLQATVPDLEFAHAVLLLDTELVDDMPILDLRVRKGIRRNGVRLAVASARPSSLDPNATAVARFAPGAGEAFLAALNAALGGGGTLAELAQAAGTTAEAVQGIADALGGEDVVIVWGERLALGARADHAARGLLNVAGHLGLAGREGAGLLEVPSSTNGRGLREVVGAQEPPLEDPTAVYLLHTDPLRDAPDRAAWDARLERATTVVAHAAFLTDGIREHATVVFPAESYAEREGTITHPDGRIQRLRQAIGLQGANRYGWQVVNDVGALLGVELRVLTAGMAFRQIGEAVPAYAGITLDEIGGHGVRWPERNAAAAGEADLGPFGLEAPPAAYAPNGHLRLGTYRSIWDAPEVDAAPALAFARSNGHVELSPGDAERLNVFHGETVLVASGEHTVEATVALRAAIPEGSVFLGGNAFPGPSVSVRKLG